MLGFLGCPYVIFLFSSVLGRVVDDKEGSHGNIHKPPHGAPSATQCVCSMCGKTCMNILDLERHYKVHMNRQPKCKVCSLVFFDRKQKDQHDLTAHREQLVAFCDICEKGFRSTWGYKFHEKMHQTKSEEGSDSQCPQCEVCGKYLQTIHHLARHLRKHSTDKPFKCDKCGRAYKHKDALNVHVCH